MKPICLRPFTKVSCNSICNDRLPNYLVSLLMHIFVQVHFSRSSNLGEAFQNPCETTCVHDLTDNSNLVILLEEIRLTTWDVKSLLRIYQLVQVEGRLLPVISRVITPVIWVKKKRLPSSKAIYGVHSIHNYSLRRRPSCSDVGPMFLSKIKEARHGSHDGCHPDTQDDNGKIPIVKLWKLHLKSCCHFPLQISMILLS